MLMLPRLLSMEFCFCYKWRMNGPRQIQNLALIGFMGTGKSCVGRMVAAQLHFDFIDTDELIETRAGKSVGEIFAQDGETAFRKIEGDLVAELDRKSTRLNSSHMSS